MKNKESYKQHNILNAIDNGDLEYIKRCPFKHFTPKTIETCVLKLVNNFDDNIEMLDHILNSQQHFSIRTSEYIIFKIACRNNKLETVKYVVNHPRFKMTYSCQDAFGSACFFDNLTIIEYLLTVPEIDLNYCSHLPLYEAYKGENANILKILISQPDVDLSINRYQFFIKVIAEQKMQFVNILLENPMLNYLKPHFQNVCLSKLKEEYYLLKLLYLKEEYQEGIEFYLKLGLKTDKIKEFKKYMILNKVDEF